MSIQLGPDPHRWPEPFKSRYAQRLRAQLTNPFEKYQEDPHGYAYDVLKLNLTDEQDEMLQSILVNRYTLCKASHAIGKTLIASVAGNWWYDCWTEHICYITAPTWPQALGLTFKSLKSQRRQHKLPGKILDTGIIRDEDNLREGQHYIRALNAEKGEGFQGEHEAPMLIIVEEGPGVPRYIWEAIVGLMTLKDCRLFVIGNPTDEATEFGAAAESDLYNVISVSALDHPNIKAELKCEPRPYPKAIDLNWIWETLKEHCERVDEATEDAFEFDSLPEIEKALSGRPASGEQWIYMPDAYFQSHALGEFPSKADHNVIPKGWLKHQSVQQPGVNDKPELGSDVARFGDDRTTIFTRRGPCALKAREIRKMDTVEVATACKDEALEAVQQWKGKDWTGETSKDDQIKLAKTVRIKIDVTGGLGAGPRDTLKRDGYNAIAVNSSSKAKDPEQFINIRSELWWNMRIRAHGKRLDLSRLRKDVRNRLERELSAPTYEAPSHKIVESKKKMKQRLGYSPDLADGANLAFYDPPIIRSEIKVTGRMR